MGEYADLEIDRLIDLAAGWGSDFPRRRPGLRRPPPRRATDREVLEQFEDLTKESKK